MQAESRSATATPRHGVGEYLTCWACWWVPFLAIGLIGAAVPVLDLDVSAAFWRDGAGFLGARLPGVWKLQSLVAPAGRLVGGGLAALFVAGTLSPRLRRRLPRGAIAFLLVTLVLGPGLAVNAGLKETWGRARPNDVVEFGGDRAFSPALEAADQCSSNCSFVSGDPSLGFWLHSFGYILPPRRRRAAVAAGVGAGTLLGLMRIAQGGHFLTDVAFSAVVVALVTASCGLASTALVRLRRRGAADPSPA